MNQKELDVLFQITIAIHEHEWFGDNTKRRDREELQEWVARQLAGCLNLYTIPCGSSWGIETTEERYNNYWKENSKIKD